MSDTNFSHANAMKNTHTRLKINALNFWEVLAQAVALISPSMTAALIGRGISLFNVPQFCGSEKKRRTLIVRSPPFSFIS